MACLAIWFGARRQQLVTQISRKGALLDIAWRMLVATVVQILITSVLEMIKSRQLLAGYLGLQD
jgi:hypothetical protein